jgi:hypothetical protein
MGSLSTLLTARAPIGATGPAGATGVGVNGASGIQGATGSAGTNGASGIQGASGSASAGSGSLTAWVNFNGTGTVAIRASGNVSSITDNGSGDFTVNFTTAMADANYSIVLGSSDNTDSGAASFSIYDAAQGGSNPTVNGCRVCTAFGYDPAYACVSIFR